MSTINERIKFIADAFFNRNVSAFARSIDVKQPTLKDIVGGKLAKPGYDIIEKIIKDKSLNINSEWLITGLGDIKAGMEDPNLDAEIEEAARELQEQGLLPLEREDVTVVPVLPMAAQAGSLDDFVESVHFNDCEKMISPIMGIDFAIGISGDSMTPEYPSGSKVLIKKINSKAFIEWGRVYVLDTCNGTVIKRLMPSENEEEIKCVSINEDYPPFKVRFEDVHGVYRVLMMLSEK